MGLLPGKELPVHVAISAWSWGAYLGGDAEENGVKVCLSPWERISPKSFKPYAKGVGGYMNSTLAKVDAVERGYDDAIMLSDTGNVAEGSGQNLFLVKENKITTPPIETGALNGITRRTVINIAEQMNLDVNEEDIGQEDLLGADELFFTGTATEVVGVVSVDNNDIGDGKPGDITNKIRKEYMNIVLGKNEDYVHWLTKVD